ncbi:hypothetical protein [Paramagnetospirillum magneticum]|uniref:Lipoprotein n=1 Tax=Paramagnetospirillum magneticum (strain ATCC 700264 / AMB-1) TaxID=342108 RepID=Q2W7N1_PARM1|nr:hypothetical protein [Paramagnetospirillum magneticum]BAE50144.1 hypothetical protein amb1340 [Paramagnetospirillum magneticum AMB-1]
MIGRVLAILGVLAVAGCAWIGERGSINPGPRPLPNSYTFMQLEALSLINTHKTMGDHVIGWITGKDCSSPRAERGEGYCRDWPDRPSPPAQVYCYSTLARPTCYSQPYNEGNDRLIGFVPASTPVR